MSGQEYHQLLRTSKLCARRRHRTIWRSVCFWDSLWNKLLPSDRWFHCYLCRFEWKALSTRIQRILAASLSECRQRIDGTKSCLDDHFQMGHTDSRLASQHVRSCHRWRHLCHPLWSNRPFGWPRSSRCFLSMRHFQLLRFTKTSKIQVSSWLSSKGPSFS